ncbi:MAG: AraC family transcriptional regulator [Myxococcota bacterium]
MLPTLMIVQRADYEELPWVEHFLRRVAKEARSTEPGAQVVLDRLIDLVFVEIIRMFIRCSSDNDQGWLSALSDPQIGDALAKIHEDPAHGWSVAELAVEVGMSRSGFAARFTELVGESPIRYLTRWRIMRGAERLLDNPQESVAEVAAAVGYDSEAAFGAAFKRIFELPPGAWRHQHPTSPPARPLRLASKNA